MNLMTILRRWPRVAGVLALFGLAWLVGSALAGNGSEAFTNVNVSEFAKLAADKGVILLDVRTAREYQSGHLAGALHLDIHQPEFDTKVAALDKAKPCLVYCASGVRSANACKVMSKLGFAKLYNLAGGILAWSSAGKPIEK